MRIFVHGIVTQGYDDMQRHDMLPLTEITRRGSDSPSAKGCAW